MNKPDYEALYLSALSQKDACLEKLNKCRLLNHNMFHALEWATGLLAKNGDDIEAEIYQQKLNELREQL